MRCSRALVVLLALFIPLISSDLAHAQHQYDRWYFGFKQGLDFRTSPPSMLTDGQTNTIEGSAVYCDPKTGDLLFYTDGVVVWDRLHRMMPSGKDLIADQSSTQAALIIPDPAEPKRFYLFHSDQSGYTRPTKGVYYSVIDLRLNGGYGDVAIKNQKLIHEGTEKLTAISLCGGEAYWVIAHELITNNYVAWSIDAGGLSLVPVKSSIGVNAGPSPVSGAGYLAASPDGKYLASVIPQPASIEIFKFNFESGQLYSRIELPAISKPYGVSFSPDNTKLYVMGDRELAQFDLAQWDSTSVAKSRFRIRHTNRSEGALRLGPDKKIYVQESDSIGVINYPNSLGDAFGYTPGQYPLIPSGQFGLPNNIDALGGHDCKIPLARIARHQTNICESTCISFKDSSRYAPTSWVWLFEGATPSISREKNPTNICYDKSGTYNVTLIAYNDSGSDTIRSIVRVKECPVPIIALKDTTLCISECVTFKDTSTIATSWQWTFENAQPSSYSGRTPPQICFYRAGKQKVTLVASNQYGYSTATAYVDVRDCSLPIAKFIHDTATCADRTLHFTDQSRNSISYDWFFAGGLPSRSNNKDPGDVYYQYPGDYQVLLVTGNKIGSDTMISMVHVSDCQKPSAKLSDYNLCEGDCIWLDDSSTGNPTYWQWKIDGGSTITSSIRTPGNICFNTPGVFELRLIAGNATGADTVTRHVTVRGASARVISSLILTEPLLACTALDTAIWIEAGCKDAIVQSITSKGPLQFGATQYTVPSGTSLRIPVTILHNETGGLETSVTIRINDRDLVIPCTYSVMEAVESFAFTLSEEPFVAGHCTPVSRALVITNEACTPQSISEVRILSSSITSPFSTDFVKGAALAPGSDREINVAFDPTMPGSMEAKLIITTASGSKITFVLRGVRNDLPVASIGVSQPSTRSLIAGDELNIAVLFESAIGDSAAPEDVQLTLNYNSDILSLDSVVAQAGWSVLERREEKDTLHLRLTGSSANISEGDVLALLTFTSFLAEEESTTVSIRDVVCNPDNAGFGTCTLDAQIGQSSSVAVTGGCGVSELRKALTNARSLSVTVRPNPIVATSGELIAHISSLASKANALPIVIELIDLQGKSITLLDNATIRSGQEEIKLKLVGIATGSYTLHTRVGNETVSTQLIVTK